MTEYVFRYAHGFGGELDECDHTDNVDHFGTLHEEIVRCRDCEYYYEVDNYHPQGNYNSRCCKYFDAYNDEVEPDGYCAWGARIEP